MQSPRGISEITATDSKIFKKSFLICESVAKKNETELRAIKPKEIKCKKEDAKQNILIF